MIITAEAIKTEATLDHSSDHDCLCTVFAKHVTNP